MGQLLDIFDQVTGSPKQTPANWAALRIPAEVQQQRDSQGIDMRVQGILKDPALSSRIESDIVELNQALKSARPEQRAILQPELDARLAARQQIGNAANVPRETQITPQNQPQSGGLLDIFDKAITASQQQQPEAWRAQREQQLQNIPVPMPMGQNNPPTGYQEPSIGKKLLGAPEAALSMATGAIAAPVAAWGTILGAPFDANRSPDDRYKAIVDTLTYQPRFEAGKAALDTAGSVLEASKLAGMGPTEGMALAGVAGMAKPRAGAVKSQQAAAGAPQASVGAAGVDAATQARAMAANASPQMQQAVEEALKRGKGNINLQALDRHVQADSLPVPVPLTKGQATGDIVMLSNEMNKRSQNAGEIAQFLNQQNKSLIENISRIRENAAPEVFVSSRPALADLIIDTYKAKDDALNAQAGAKYAALKNANNGDFPIDIKALDANIGESLKKELKTRFVPTELKMTIKDLLRDGKMSFEDFEYLRTITANIQRESNNGNARAAAGIIRNELEKLPLPKEAQHLKPLADEARAAVKIRYDLMKNDPAYKAVVTEKASADKFIDKYIIGADTKSVEVMRNNLAGNSTAQQAMSAGVIDFLRRQSGIIGDQGNFSQAGFNRALEGLQPKLNVLFNPQDKQNLDRLGNVARWTQEQPRGSFVNNSNTFVAAMGEKAANLAEGAANVVVPYAQIGSIVRQAAQKAKTTKELRSMLAPGAGLMEKK